MTTALTTGTKATARKDARTGLTLPLSRHLGLQDLAKHRAMLAMELEYLAKKFDRYGWDRDRNTAAQDRQKLDFMDALQDYPLDEVRAACKAVVLASPNRMPNEGHIVAQVLAERKRAVTHIPKQETQDEARKRVTAERAAQIVAAAGFAPRRFGQ